MLALGCLAALILAQAASAARTVYFSDPVADEISQYSVGPGGALTPLARLRACGGPTPAGHDGPPALTSTPPPTTAFSSSTWTPTAG